MNILLACELYHPSKGGVQHVMRQVAEHLAARGHRVTVATRRLAERESRELNGVAIREFDVEGNAVRGMRGDIEGYRAFVAAGDYDVLLIKAAQQWTFDALLGVLGQVRRPKVFVPCGFSSLYEPTYAEYYRAMPQALRAFDRLVFYASRYRDIEFARRHGLERIDIVPNGADEREFAVARDPRFRARHGIADDAFVALTVGSLTGQKGHQELADAFALARFPQQHAVLLLNGNRIPLPPQEVPSKTLRRRAGRWGRAAAAALTGDERFTRRDKPWPEVLDATLARINREPGKRALLLDLPRAEVIQAFLNSDLFVLASQVEYSPLVLFEAAAAGLPFLSVPAGNAEEIIEWTGGGMLCPAPIDERGVTRVDPTSLAERMTALAGDRERRAALGRAGQAAWHERFTWEAISLRYEAILQDVVSAGGR
jgi:glycosyltransferase involved in cell wall biosynthesis